MYVGSVGENAGGGLGAARRRGGGRGGLNLLVMSCGSFLKQTPPLQLAPEESVAQVE